MSQFDTIDQNVDLISKVGSVFGKAVDLMLKKITLAEDPLDFDVSVLTSEEKIKKISELKNQGRKFFFENNIVPAISYFKVVLQIDNKDNDAIKELLYFMCNSPAHYIEILPLYESLDLNIIDDFMSSEIKATVFYLKNDLKSAQDILESFIEKGANFTSFSSNYIYGSILMKSSPEKALNFFSDAISYIPDNIDSHLKLKECHKILGNTDQLEIENDIINFLS